jgi:3-oxoadipate enol-lactonase
LKLQVESSGEGPPLLLLHGLGSSGVEWEHVAPALARRHRVIVPDVRGHGRSEKPPGPYSVPMFAQDVAAMLDGQGVKGAHVAGLSMGGMIAFQLALDRPDLVRSLTIINSGPALVPKTFQQRWALLTRVLILRWLGPRAWARVLASRLFPKPEQEALRRQTVDRFGGNPKAPYLAATRALIGWSVLDRVKEIACPVLVVGSDRDYSTTEVKRAYMALLRDARLVEVRDSGHAATTDQPGQVLAAMEAFLDEVERSGQYPSAQPSFRRSVAPE